MEFVPYEHCMRSIEVYQLKESGWILLIRFPIKDYEKATAKDIQEKIESIYSSIFNARKLKLSIQGVSLYLRGLDQNQSTFKVVASGSLAELPI